MSEYITKTYGPGDIAALPPTIGMTSRAPTIGSEDVGHPIKQAFPFKQKYIPGATQVEAAGLQYPMGADNDTPVSRAKIRTRRELEQARVQARARRTRELTEARARARVRAQARKARRLARAQARRALMAARRARPMSGFGTEANVTTTNNGNGATPSWMLPVGIGLVLGGLYVMYSKKQEGGGIFANMGGDAPTCNGCD